MIRMTLTAAILMAASSVARAFAGTLTCDVFKTRVDQALQRPGAAAMPPLRFVPIREGIASGSRYAWSGIPGLLGKLTCGPDDAFADFYMMVDPASRQSATVPSDISRFRALGAASICALSAGTPEACEAMMTAMTQDGIDQYEDDLAQHDEHPQSLQDYDFAKDLDAVFYVTPRAMSWAIGPGLYTTVEADRPALVPADRDKDDAKDD